ncbi:MAG: HIT domain-containing protein [archaeon]
MKKLFDIIIFETNNFTIAQDWEVPIPAFFVIATKRKIVSIAKFSNEEAAEFITLVKKLRIAMKNELKIDNVYFFQNEDSVYGFHFWVFPRYKWMDKFGKKIESVRTIIEYAKTNLTNKKNKKKVNISALKIKKIFNR